MKISITFLVDEDLRRAIDWRTNNDGRPASYADCRRHIETAVEGDFQAIQSDFDEACSLVRGDLQSVQLDRVGKR